MHAHAHTVNTNNCKWSVASCIYHYHHLPLRVADWQETYKKPVSSAEKGYDRNSTWTIGGRTRWDGRCRRGRGCDLVEFMQLAWKYIRMPRENETARVRLWLGGVYAVCKTFTRKPHDSYRRQFRHHYFVVSCLFSRTFSSGPLPLPPPPPPPTPARGYVYVPARVRVHFIFAVWLYTTACV